MHSLRLGFWTAGIYFCMLTACQKEELPIVFDDSSLTRAVPTLEFDWENADWMPTPVGQSRIPSPWVGAGSLASLHGLEILDDRRKADGWELLYSTFDTKAPGPIANPYFIIYNK